MTYTGSGAAITVEADNVTINFANHSLFLTDPAAEGVLAVDVEEFTLLNDKISLNQISNVSTSNAIRLSGVSKAKIDNIYTENTLRGIRIEDSNDITITNTHHKNHVGGNNDVVPLSGTGIEVRFSTGVTVDNSFFEGSSGANNFGDGSIAVNGGSNIIITNTKHSDVAQALFVAGASKGILVDNLVANFNSEAFYGGINIGGADDEDPTTDIILQNVTLTNLDALEGWDGINVGLASGLRFDNIIIDVDTSIANDFTPAALHFGCFLINGCNEGEKTSSQGLFTNIVINNINAYGLLVESGRDLVFDNIEVTGSVAANAYIDSALGVAIQNSYIGDSSDGDGIVVTEKAVSTTIFNNTVTGNDDGILILAGATNTSVDSNRVFGNNFGISNSASSTITEYNRVCGNGNNCSGVFPNNSIGDPSVVGENTCNCDPE